MHAGGCTHSGRSCACWAIHASHGSIAVVIVMSVWSSPRSCPSAGTSSCCLAWSGHRPTCWTHNLVTIRAEYPPRGCLVPTAMTEARYLQSSGELMHGTICATMLTTRHAVCNRQVLKRTNCMWSNDRCERVDHCVQLTLLILADGLSGRLIQPIARSTVFPTRHFRSRRYKFHRTGKTEGTAVSLTLE